METENNDQLSCLDILVTRAGGEFSTGMLRNRTFTDPGLNYFSYCFNILQLNSCKTLNFRCIFLMFRLAEFQQRNRFPT